MKNTILVPVAMLLVCLLSSLPAAADASGVAAWSEGVRVGPLTPDHSRHTFHTYYLTNPESPDGRHVLYFTSTDPAGHFGDVRILERASGKEIILARNIHTEDAHRAACQQWLSDGRRVAFHEVVDKRWRVVVIDPENPKEWAIVVGDLQTGKRVMLHRFDQSQGAKSWRRSHPHPVFSADGRRIYYNVSDGPFTRLFVAERR